MPMAAQQEQDPIQRLRQELMAIAIGGKGVSGIRQKRRGDDAAARPCHADEGHGDAGKAAGSLGGGAGASGGAGG